MKTQWLNECKQTVLLCHTELRKN